MADGTLKSSWHPAFMPNSAAHDTSSPSINETPNPSPTPTHHTTSSIYSPDEHRSNGEIDASTTATAPDHDLGFDNQNEGLHPSDHRAERLSTDFQLGLLNNTGLNSDISPESRDPEGQSLWQGATADADTWTTDNVWPASDKEIVHDEERAPDLESDLLAQLLDGSMVPMNERPRTNSFPSVPPAPEHDSAAPFDGLQLGSVGTIHNENRDLLYNEAEHRGELSNARGTHSASESLDATSMPMDSEMFGDAFGARIPLKDDEPDRYEEGVPLLGPEIADDLDGADYFASKADIECVGGDGSEDLHIAERTATSDVEPMLARKSTMRAMHVEELPEGNDFDVFNLSTENLEAADFEKSLQTQPSEDDLAAKWQALLEEDDLLDDDDDSISDNGFAIEASNMDPATLFASDDEGFLDDDDEGNGFNVSGVDTSAFLTSGSQPHSFTGIASQDRYTPFKSPSDAISNNSNRFAPSAHTLGNSLLANIPAALNSGSNIAPSYLHQANLQRPAVQKTESFVNQSKGGYSSPYDLPMDVVKPRKRTSAQGLYRGQSESGRTGMGAPPRSSSMITSPSQAALESSGESLSAISSMSSISRVEPQFSAPPTGARSEPKPVVTRTQSSFFEELPVLPKSKSGRQTPQQKIVPSDQASNTLQTLTDPRSMATVSPPNMASSSAVPDLVVPPKANPYATLNYGSNVGPASNTRYSPNSQQVLSGAPPTVIGQGRQAVPSLRQQSSTVPFPSQALPYQPRTSSPLAYVDRSAGSRQTSDTDHTHRKHNVSDQRMGSGQDRFSGLSSTIIQHEQGDEDDETPHHTSVYDQQRVQTDQSSMASSVTTHVPQGMKPYPARRSVSHYMPVTSSQSARSDLPAIPLQRSHTQSPSVFMSKNKVSTMTTESQQRPVSAHAPINPATSLSSGLYKRPRGLSHKANYVAPADGTEQDALQRWRGAPVLAWGVGGAIVTAFPKDVPRYSIGQSAPMILRSPGEIRIRNMKDVKLLDERLSSFPGPLKNKSKKKEVVSWLSAGIAHLEETIAHLPGVSPLSHDEKRKEERVLLWKVLRIMVEYDGLLEGSAEVDRAVRKILSPEADEVDPTSAASYATGSSLSGIFRPASTIVQPEAVDPAAVDQLRRHLLKGEREKAVWEAVDKRLWAHAMLISNTLSGELYRRVAQEFIQKEVKTTGANTESLASLYEVFAGNFEESVDELVPPSARAGFQMINAVGPSEPAKDALDGLDRWRETLGLILSNRSPDDNIAINGLGKLLAGYGRAEAAHICFIFARTHSVFAGLDDPSANIVLVGADHLQHPDEFDKELEIVLLTEIYEFGLSLATTSALQSSVPHLAIYKFQHARILAEHGLRDQALQYCESIAGTITSQTRRSPYHHQAFAAALDDLSKRLKQSPKDGSSSWMSKPSIDKVSGSVWAKFNKFVAGDENDQNPAAIAEPGLNVGPFARIAGGTPTISRSPSNTELVNSYSIPLVNASTMPIPAGTKTSSRYAPTAAFTPSSYPDTALSSSHGSQSNQYMPNATSMTPPTTNDHVSNHQSQNNSPFGQSAESQFYQINGPAQASRSIMPPSTSAPSFTAAQNPTNFHQDARNTLSQPDPPLPGHAGYDFGQQSSTSFIVSQQPSLLTTELLSQQGERDHPSGLPDAHESPRQSYDLPQQSYEFQQSYEPPQQPSEPSQQSYEPSQQSYEPPQQSYEPPQQSYEPPQQSYEPLEQSNYGYMPPEDESNPEDDEIGSSDAGRGRETIIEAADETSGTRSREKSKAEKDREADEAFRKAAEADSKRDAQQPAKKGWGIGGWFGGTKKDPAMEAAQPAKAIRAKLGEESSFYYDAELKKWVNKKADKGDATSAPGSTPPPPKAGPPKSIGQGSGITANLPPTSAPRPPLNTSSSSTKPAQRSLSETAMTTDDVPPPNGLMIPPQLARTASNTSAAGPASGPPSRPATSMSNASSIDDLLGPPTARKGAAKKAKRGRGYIDVMEKSAA